MKLLEPPPLPGDTVATYRIMSTIGIGGNATVFRAECSERGPVALKILHPGKTSPEDLRRFQREFLSLKALDHTNIVKVIETGEHGAYPWISMEIVEGSDLSALISHWNSRKDSGKYLEIIHIIRQLCDALSYIHDRSMIHRDLKPNNVLVFGGIERISENPNVKLTDFGGVKAPTTFRSELTTMGALIGTVAFMAPEHIMGEDLTPAADLYALGALLYICLTGKKPFESGNIAGYLSLHLTRPAPDPRTLFSEIPAELAELCTELLQKDPQNRPQSAQCVANKLSQFTQESAIEITNNRLFLYAAEHQLINSLLEQGTPTIVAMADSYPQELTTRVLTDIQTDRIDEIRILSEAPTSETLSDVRLSATIVLCDHRNKDAWSQALNWPVMVLRPETITPLQLRRSLSHLGCSSSAAGIISQRFCRLFQGHKPYISVALQQWILEHGITPSPDSVTLLQRTGPTIPDSIKHHLLQQRQPLPETAQFILDACLVFATPISLRMLSLLLKLAHSDVEFSNFYSGISPDLSSGLQLLLQHDWLQQQERELVNIIQVHKSKTEKLFERLIDTEIKRFWNLRIAEMLERSRRKQCPEYRKIGLHLERAEQPSKAFKMFVRGLLKYVPAQPPILYQSCRERALALLDTSISEFPEETMLLCQHLCTLPDSPAKDKLKWCELGISCAQTLNADESLVDLLTLRATLSPEIAHFNEAIGQLNPGTERWCKLLHHRACHSLLRSSLPEAQELWAKLLTTTDSQQSVEGRFQLHRQLAFAGLSLLTTSPDTAHFFRNIHSLEIHPSVDTRSPETWKLWLLEAELLTGRWGFVVQAVELILAQMDNNPSPEYLVQCCSIAGIAECWRGDQTRALNYFELAQNAVLAHPTLFSPEQLHNFERLRRQLKIAVRSALNERLPNLPAQEISMLFWKAGLRLLDICLYKCPSQLAAQEELWNNRPDSCPGLDLRLADTLNVCFPSAIWAQRVRQGQMDCQLNQQKLSIL